MRVKTLSWIAAVSVLVALSSCASLQHSWDQGNVTRVADLINAGDAKTLAAMSGSPFLIDGEVVPLKEDVNGFWSGIIKAGYKVEGPALGSAAPVSADSYKRFADTMEAKAFFTNYVKKDARILELKTSTGKTILLIVMDKPFSKKTVQGFKGPY